MLSRQHPLVLLLPLLRSVGLLLLFIFLFALQVPNWLLGVSAPVLLVLAGVSSWRAHHHWDNTVVILTNKRLMITEQHTMLHRSMSECSLLSIQQVGHDVRGLLGSMFGYGTIEITTAGSKEPLHVPNVPKVYEVEQEIQRAAAALEG